MKPAIIGLIGAMDEEIEYFHEHMTEVVPFTCAGIVFHTGRFHGREVVLCKSGVGKVNAAVCTGLLIHRFACTELIFTGVAGALDPALEIGDIVLSNDCMQHDMDVSPLGYARGVIPYQETSIFPADARLLELAESAANKLKEGRVVIGRVLSGDQFIARREKVAELRHELNGACAEMEGAAVAQVCAMSGIPFVIIRSMSDKADGSAPGNFPAFSREAAARSFRIVQEMILLLPQMKE